MRPNAANLDNLKHDKEQDDRKTIKGAGERVWERANRGCKKVFKKGGGSRHFDRGNRKMDFY